MSIVDKAKELSEQAISKINDLGGDDLIVTTILRVVDKEERLNLRLAEQGSPYRITGIEIDNMIPPKVVFTLSRESD